MRYIYYQNTKFTILVVRYFIQYYVYDINPKGIVVSKSPESEAKTGLPTLEDIAKSLTVEIKRYEIKPEQMSGFLSYVKDQRKLDPKAIVSLKYYVRDLYNKENKEKDKDNIVIVPDFSGLTIGETAEHDVEALQAALKAAFEKDEAADMSDPAREGEANFLKNMKKVLAEQRENNRDLSGVDFTGCRMVGAVFESCNLTGADIRDADLSGVVLNDCIAKGMDLRGSNISGLEFDELGLKKLFNNIDEIKEESITILAEYDYSQRYVDIHYSTSESMLHRYREDNKFLLEEAEADFEQRRDEDLLDKREQLEVAKVNTTNDYNKVSMYQRTLGGKEYATYITTQKKQIAIEEKIAAINKQEFDQEKAKIKYVVHPSVIKNLLLVSDSVRNKYDPAYERGSSKEKAEGKNQYVRLTREDAEEYLKSCADRPDLSINDFAKEKMFSKKGKKLSGARVVADFSVRINEADKNAVYAGIATDLSGLDFSNRDLRGACFVGANVQDCNFTGATLNATTFEGADASRANFTGASARDANFKAAKIESAIIKDSDFTRAYMPHARVHDLDRDEVFAEVGEGGVLNISGSNFNFADLSNSDLDGAKIKDSKFNHADLSGVSLAGADIQRCKMRHANLTGAILENCEIAKSDLTGSILIDVRARNIKLKAVVLENVHAKNIDLTGAELDKLCKLLGADLENAIMRKVKAAEVDFYNVNMEKVNLELADLSGAIVKDVNLRFANLEGVIAHGIKAAGVDMTEANITDIKAKGGDFANAQLERIIARRADLEKSVLAGAKLRGAQMCYAILKGANLNEADFRNVHAAGLDLERAEVDRLKVNADTNFHNALINGTKGVFNYIGNDGTIKTMTPEEKVEIDRKVEAVKNRSSIAKWFGRPAQAIGGVMKRVGRSIKHPSTKWGRIIGTVMGVAAASSIVVGTVLSAGLSLPITAAIIGGSLLVGGGVGAVAGHFVAKKDTISMLLGSIGGFLVAGGPGAAVGAVAGVVGADLVKEATGKTPGQVVADAVIGAGGALQAFGDEVVRGEELLKAQEESKASYQALQAAKITEAKTIKPIFDIAEYEINRQAALEASKENAKANSPSLPSPEQRDKVRERAKSVGDGMEQAMKKAPSRPRTQSQSKPPKGREME